MLQAYRKTPHPTIGTAPYKLQMSQTISTKLDHYQTGKASRDENVRERDNQYKQKLNTFHDTRHRAKEYKFKIREAVLLKHEKKLKGKNSI